MDSSVTPAYRSSYLKDYTEYTSWLSETNHPDNIHSFLIYLNSIIVPRATSSPFVQRHASAINRRRTLLGLTPYTEEPLLQKFLAASRSHLPSSPKYLKDPTKVYDVRLLAHQACSLSSDSLSSLRLKTLILLRIVALLRSKDASTILRDSIQETTDLTGRRLVVFKYIGKYAIKHKLEWEMNYLEFTPDESRCPATAILALKAMVDTLSPHTNNLFVDLRKPHGPIGEERLANIVYDFMRKCNIDPSFTAHSIRTMTSELLGLLGVPALDIDKRGAWANKNPTLSSVRLQHYNSRLSPLNFASLLVCVPSPDGFSLQEKSTGE